MVIQGALVPFLNLRGNFSASYILLLLSICFKLATYIATSKKLSQANELNTMLHKYIQEKQVNRITKFISIYKVHIKNGVKL